METETVNLQSQKELNRLYRPQDDVEQDPLFYFPAGTILNDEDRLARFAIRSHPWAPDIRTREEGALIIKQAIKEITSRNFQVTESVRIILRQVGYVSLYFALKYIAAFNGPFELLDENIHLSMCNFRQSDYCMEEGARFAIFIFRGVYKTTIITIGGSFWEAIRNPNIRIRIVNAKVERAHDFKNTVKFIFDSNELFAWLYGCSKDKSGSYVPESGQQRWNNTEFVLPNRKRYYKEPTIAAGGATGASEGDHHDMLLFDDLVGEEDIDSEKHSSTTMRTKIQWVENNATTLLTRPARDRVGWSATLWAADDVNSLVWKQDMKRLVGWRGTVLTKFEKPEGAYTVYYRKADEGGVASCPDIMPLETLNKLKKDKPWTYWLQYQNEPISPESIEFYHYEPKFCTMIYDGVERDFLIVQKGYNQNMDLSDEGDYKVLRAKKMDFVLSTDLAFTETGPMAKICRTSLAVWAMDSEKNVYRVLSNVGKFEINLTFKLIGDMLERMQGYVHTVIFESNSAQKALIPFLEVYLLERGIYVKIEPKNVSSNKVARIRNTLGWFLKQSKVWLSDGCSKEFIEEKDIFPNVDTRMDVLDESEKGLSFLRAPESDEEIELRELEEEEQEAELVDDIIGY